MTFFINFIILSFLLFHFEWNNEIEILDYDRFYFESDVFAATLTVMELCSDLTVDDSKFVNWTHNRPTVDWTKIKPEYQDWIPGFQWGVEPDVEKRCSARRMLMYFEKVLKEL